MDPNNPPFSAKLHRICAQCEASAALHPEEPDPVQVVGLRHVSRLRVHRLCCHHAQYPLPSHEILPTAQGENNNIQELEYKDLDFQLYTTFLDSLNIIFTVFFTLEFVLKFGAFRFKVGPSYPIAKVLALST